MFREEAEKLEKSESLQKAREKYVRSFHRLLCVQCTYICANVMPFLPTCTFLAFISVSGYLLILVEFFAH